MIYYWYAICHFCEEGRLIITKNKDTNTLYLHCDECERGWKDPEAIEHVASSCLTFLERFEIDYPTPEEIVTQGWEKYMAHSFTK